MKCVFLVLLVTNYAIHIQCQKSCTTPKNSTGICVPISVCQSLFRLVKPAMTAEETDLLRNSQCGFEGLIPKVCCEKCFTPEGYIGECVDLNDCPRLASLTRSLSEENKQYIQNSRCLSQFTVCCPGEQPETRLKGCTRTAALPNPTDECCGIDASSDTRIYGGTATAIDQYPWLAHIDYSPRRQYAMCGATLISNKYVLTAAHCVTGAILRHATPDNVVLGEYDMENEGSDCVETAGGFTDCTDGAIHMPIERITVHPDYNPNQISSKNDIALIRLQDTVTYTDFIRPICLPRIDISLSPPGLRMYVSGWGLIDERHSSRIKQHVDVPTVGLESCQSLYARANVSIWNKQLCAGGEGGKDSCKGDSGGPLMYRNGKTYEIIGVTSYGPKPCGRENAPGVYTKVYGYLNWIRMHMVP